VTHLLFAAFPNRPDALSLAAEARTVFASEGVDAVVFALDSDQAPELTAESLVIALGGDGTFLKASRLAHSVGAKILGVNLGRVGFLLRVEPSDLIAAVRSALSSDIFENRLALDIEIDGRKDTGFALNEVVVERDLPGHMVKVSTMVDREEYLSYVADGLMVSTPTGSTAYNFSAGGPVVEPDLDLMILTPIAPHFTISRSVVMPGSRVIRIVAIDRPAVIVTDGVLVGKLELGQGITVRKSVHPVRVVGGGDLDLALRLRRGLREGHA
jgi:NAD+ kinase